MPEELVSTSTNISSNDAVTSGTAVDFADGDEDIELCLGALALDPDLPF